MNKNNQRVENREIINDYYSVEINLEGCDILNQYVIYDMSSSGLCLLVKEDSLLLKKIKVGGKYKMKYYPVNILGSVEYIETKICHITKSVNLSFHGHYMVGLSFES